MTHGISGLYAVTPDVADTPRLIAMAQAALAGGARLLQYRNKSAGPALRLAQARALLELCRNYRASFIVNDHLDLALAVNADGLHLGADDGSLAAARAQLGPARLLGASCYDRLELALEAERLGADYVAFGSFYPSRVKPGAVRASLALMREARRRLSIPVVAIGGITHENAPQLIAAGAHCVAVVSALFDADDVRLAARRFSALFAQNEPATRVS
ncbi:MAG: thiamine phosphate synthase [Burkholderiales bacterium]